MLDETFSIDAVLYQIRFEASQLSSLVNLLADEPPEVRDIWHWKWQGLLESIETLCLRRRDGVMSEFQEREFLAISRLLTESRSLIEALGCRLPLEIDQSLGASG